MASLSPVIVTTWLDPPLQTDFQTGTSVTWRATFQDPQTRAAVDPDIVNFIYSWPAQTTATTVTYPTGIVKDTVGGYHFVLALTLLGRAVLTVAPQGNPGAVGIGNASLEIYINGTGQ